MHVAQTTTPARLQRAEFRLRGSRLMPRVRPYSVSITTRNPYRLLARHPTLKCVLIANKGRKK